MPPACRLSVRPHRASMGTHKCTYIKCVTRYNELVKLPSGDVPDHEGCTRPLHDNLVFSDSVQYSFSFLATNPADVLRFRRWPPMRTHHACRQTSPIGAGNMAPCRGRSRCAWLVHLSWTTPIPSTAAASVSELSTIGKPCDARRHLRPQPGTSRPMTPKPTQHWCMHIHF